MRRLREVKILLDRGANVDIATSDRLTPLHIAVEENHPEVVLCDWAVLCSVGVGRTASSFNDRTFLVLIWIWMRRV